MLREGAKNILRGGGAKSAAFGRQMRTPPIFKYLLCETSTNEYPNIFMRQKVARTNIRIYSAGKNETNIFEYEYIRNKIFEYIRISEYSLYTGLTLYLIVLKDQRQTTNDGKTQSWRQCVANIRIFEYIRKFSHEYISIRRYSAKI